MTKNNKDKDFGVINSHSWKSQRMNSQKTLSLSCFLPFGKAEDTESPSLSRIRGSLLQLQPRRLGSPATSTFATSGLIDISDFFFQEILNGVSTAIGD